MKPAIGLQQLTSSGPLKSLCEVEKIYDLVPRTDDVFNLNRSELELHDELGAGNFGSVMRGTYRHKGLHIPVAVKMLKKDDMPTAEVGFSCFVYLALNGRLEGQNEIVDSKPL